MWQSFVNFIAEILSFIAHLFASGGIPYSFGFSIITFTLLIKIVTFPLNMKQLQSSKMMAELQPELQKLQKKYAKDKDKLAQEQMRLYKEAGINPLGGCLPMLVQMPIWFALYRALYQLAEQGVLKEGFFFIPSLAMPPTNMSWIWPLPPSIGWGPALAYLVLPVLTVVTQLVVQNMTTPTNADPQQKSMNQMMMFMPFMFGFFALQVPSGLALYWVVTNLFSMLQQYYVNHTVMKPKAASAKEITSGLESKSAKEMKDQNN
jgi:YidC/Oxa1 family membrane protein insertase